MQKARRLVDENSVSFQMFLILLSFITLGSESQISVFKQCKSNTLGFFLYGGNMHRSQNLEMHVVVHIKALRSVQFLMSFISFYFEILSYLACGEKIIRLTSKNSVKLDEKSASDF